MEISRLALFWFECLVAFFFLFGTLFVASGIAERFLSGASMLARRCGTIVIGLWLASVGFHLLSVFGLFRVWAGVIALCCLMGIVRMSGYSLAELLEGLRQDVMRLSTFLHSISRPLQRTLLSVLGIGAILVAARCLLMPPLSWDALTYHAVKAGMWVQSGHPWLMEAPGGWFNYRTYPGGAEVFQAWAMLPFHNDFFLCMVDFIQWLALIPALSLLGDCLGLERRDSFIGALFCAFVPAVVFMVGSCYGDLTFALSVILGAAFLARFFSRNRPANLALGLMSFGIAGGIKHFAYLLICLVLAVVLLYVVLHRKTCPGGVWGFCLAVSLMLAPIIPWFVYNVLTGQPLFPFPLKIAGIPFGVSSPATDWYLDFPQVRPYDLWLEAEAFTKLFLWPWSAWYHREMTPNFGLLALVPSCIFPFAMISLTKRQVWIGLLVGSVVAAMVGSYYLPNFSVVRQLWAASSARFLFEAFMPMVIVSLLAFHGDPKERYVDFLLLASVFHLGLGISMYWQLFEFQSMALTVSLIAFGVATVLFLTNRLTGLKYSLALSLVIAVCLSGLLLVRNHARYGFIARSYFFHDIPRYWVEAAKRVDTPSVRQTIAVTSGPYQRCDNWFMYLFMGRSLQNLILYVPVTESGVLAHFGPYARTIEPLSYQSWLARIQTNGVTEVMSFAPRSIELLWMHAHPESFDQIIGNSQFGLFRVKTRR